MKASAAARAAAHAMARVIARPGAYASAIAAIGGALIVLTPAARAVDLTPPTIAPSAAAAPERAAPARDAATAPAPAASSAGQVTPAPLEADARVDAAGGEPFVKHTVIDDGRARIEELRVRGQLKKVTVEPKGPAPGYEILLGDGAHVVGDDPGTSRGSAGKRVWNVLRF